LGIFAYLAALAATVVVTSTVLWYKHGRNPFGDHGLALRWWVAVVAIDGIVAALLLTGSLALASLGQLEGVDGIARGIAIGILGPLGIRSPIREVNIGGKPEKVGITTIYDRTWIYCDRRLDGQITLLRRKDREAILEDVQNQGWDPPRLAQRIEEHVSDLRSLTKHEQELIIERTTGALSLPSDVKRLLALIKVMLDERLNSLVGEVRENRPGEG
jgi:hypothetical protein